MVTCFPFQFPGNIVPPYTKIDGRLSLAMAIMVPGKLLSHPEIPTSASYMCALIIISIESAITSRLTSEAFIPSCPIAIPSETETAVNSLGVQPESLTPDFECCAKSPKWMLQGVASLQVDETPTIGFDKSSSFRPIALYIALCGALAGPLTTVLLISSITEIEINAYFNIT